MAVLCKLSGKRDFFTPCQKFNQWLSRPIQFAGLSAAIVGRFIVPKKYRIPRFAAFAIPLGTRLVGALGSLLAEQFWAGRSAVKKRSSLREEERNLYDQFVQLDRDISLSIKTVLN